jgi:hypothetical protein
MPTAEELTVALNGTWDAQKQQGIAFCPAHNDIITPSLSIGVRSDGHPLLHCHAGCQFKDIVEALKQRGIDLQPPQAPMGCTLADYAAAKQLPIPFLQKLGLKNTRYAKAPAVTIPYHDESGKETAIRFRRTLHKARGAKDERFAWRTGSKVSLYGLERLSAVTGDSITLVEGESDAQTLWLHDIPALGIAGASNWRDERDAKHVERFTTIYVVIEPDTGGDNLRKRLLGSVIRHRVKLVRLPVKDPSSLYLSGPSIFLTAWGAAIVAAEGWTEGPDPLEGLIERTLQDPGAPFAKDVVERLIALRANDPGVYETLLARLKNETKCRVHQLERKLKADDAGEKGEGASQTDTLVTLALEQADLFHTPEGKAYADIELNGHRQTWAVRGTDFRNWLAFIYFEATQGVVSSEAQRTVVSLLEARAKFAGPEREVFTRVGGAGDNIYLDLGCPEWKAVEITAAGWRVIDRPPVRFRRSRGMLPLPVPEAGGSIDELRPFLNVTPQHFIMVVAWLLAALRPYGPYPILGVSGEKGGAKTMLLKLLRRLIDPHTPEIRALPQDDRTLFLYAKNRHIQAFDNVSVLMAWLADLFSQLATGGGFTTRELYTDDDENIFNGMRPIAMNGIPEIVEQADLADRALVIKLETIPEEKRQTEAELEQAFNQARPKILGALLTAVAGGLRELPTIKLKEKPRMADFAVWIVACEKAFDWAPGTFMAVYAANVEEATETVLEADPVAMALITFMASRPGWDGTASDLLKDLSGIVGERIQRSSAWPKLANQFAGKLRRAAPLLRDMGISIEFYKKSGGKDGKRTRKIRVYKAPESKRPHQGNGADPQATAHPVSGVHANTDAEEKESYVL